MTNRILSALLAAAVTAAACALPAGAQTTPVVAKLSVPVSISDIDTEWLQKTFGGLLVHCDVFEQVTPPARGSLALASGQLAIPLQETPATTTVRSTMKYSGTLEIPTYAPQSASDAKTDPETAAQEAAHNAIVKARSFGCYFAAANASANGISKAPVSSDIDNVLKRGYQNSAAEKSSVFFVSGTFPKH